MTESIWFWIGFLILVGLLLILDLGLFNKGSRHISISKALKLTGFWIGIALLFGVFVYFQLGQESAVEYYTAYVVEKAMSVDNIFVFIIIFSYFCVPDEYQHKALFYGIVGAIIFRAVFILLGVELINRFDWIMYIFGALLVYAAIKTMTQKERDAEKTCENAVVRGVRKLIPVTETYEGDKIFVRREYAETAGEGNENGKRKNKHRKGALMATPLFLAIIALESSDLLFAIDSIPAVLAISTDTFIVYTSNIFAILGLRSLYFAIRGVMNSFHYLKYGLGVILLFVGVKMFISNFYHISVVVSLAVILGVLLISILISVWKNKRDASRAGSF